MQRETTWFAHGWRERERHSPSGRSDSFFKENRLRENYVTSNSAQGIYPGEMEIYHHTTATSGQ